MVKSVPKIEQKQTDGWTEAIALPPMIMRSVTSCYSKKCQWQPASPWLDTPVGCVWWHCGCRVWTLSLSKGRQVHVPPKCPSVWGSKPLSSTWFLVSMWVCTQMVSQFLQPLLGLAVVTNAHIDTQTKRPLYSGRNGLHLALHVSMRAKNYVDRCVLLFISFRDCCSRCRFQPYNCVIIRFVE